MRSPSPTIALLAAGLLAALPCAHTVTAQQGDRAGESQPALPPELRVPPAPVLSPDEQWATLRVPDGLVVELVAAEPLVNDPVAVAFDALGRLWVVEMTGYMPDVNGEGERSPVGAVAVLSDTDDDGRMDQRVDFLSGLVLPRAVVPTRDGALVIAPPDLLFCRDLDGDGRADERIVVDTGLAGLVSPEHAPNALLPTLDNTIACANLGRRYRFVDAAWAHERVPAGGQWGLTQDDDGRLYFNTNSDPLRADLVPSFYSLRNPHHGPIAGVNVGLALDHAVHPARMTPGVNRGYRPETLRDDFTLRTVTAACGPWIHRGTGLGQAYRGSAFVCEPAANVVQRFELSVTAAGGLQALNPHGELDFLTSTDERFRPVNLTDGPDGALYVVDMYRGILQHRIFMTSWLRTQVLERGLDRPVGLGRIWRVRAEQPPGSVRRGGSLPTTEPEQLVGLLSHAEGWWRDRAQQTLVESWFEVPQVVESVREHLASTPSALGRLHALWTLAGIGGLDADTVQAALGDSDPRVQRAAVRLSERYLLVRRSLVPLLLACARRGDPALRHQVLLSLGAADTEETNGALHALLTEDADSPEARSAVISGLYQREFPFLERLLDDPRWREPLAGREKLLTLLARCVTREGRTDRIEQMLALATDRARTAPYQSAALLGGLLSGRGMQADGSPSRIALAVEPAAARALRDWPAEHDAAALAAEVHAALAWPGHPDPVTSVFVAPLSAEQHELFARGRELYTLACATCHQASGRGEPGKAPRLTGSAWVLGDPGPLLRILLHGLEGPLEVDGRIWDQDMPGLGGGLDAEIAAVATYIRREWGHGAAPVDTRQVAEVRAATAEREEPWTVAELESPSSSR